MAVSALPHSSKDPNQLLPEQYIFEIFLNASTPSVIYNNTDLILPLDPPDTLQRLFQSFTSQYPLPKNFPFSPIVRHTKIKKSTKGSFLVSTIAHTIYLTTTCVVVALIAPQVYPQAQKVKNTSSSFNSAEDPFHTSIKCFQDTWKQGSQIYMPTSLGINYHHYYNHGNHSCVPLQGM